VRDAAGLQIKHCGWEQRYDGWRNLLNELAFAQSWLNEPELQVQRLHREPPRESISPWVDLVWGGWFGRQSNGGCRPQFHPDDPGRDRAALDAAAPPLNHLEAFF